MKFKKFVSVMLALSMAAAVAGCSKVKSVSIDDFTAACESLGATEFDPDDNPGPDEDDMADGVYTVMDSDYIEDNLSEDDLSIDTGIYGSFSPDLNSIIDVDDIEMMGIYMRMEQNAEDLNGMEDVEDLDVDICAAVQITLTDADQAADIMENIADQLDESADIDVNNLSSSEYYSNKNQGYLKLHIDAADLVAAFEDSDLHDVLGSFLSDDMDDLDDALANISGGVSIAFYINGENIVVIIGANVNRDAEFIDEFCSKIGLANPDDLDSNTEVAESIMDAADSAMGSMMSGYASYDY